MVILSSPSYMFNMNNYLISINERIEILFAKDNILRSHSDNSFSCKHKAMEFISKLS